MFTNIFDDIHSKSTIYLIYLRKRKTIFSIFSIFARFDSVIIIDGAIKIIYKSVFNYYGIKSGKNANFYASI